MAIIRDGIYIVTWEVTQGDTWTQTFTLTDDATGDALDATGYTWRASAFSARGTTDAAELEFTVTTGGTTDSEITLTAGPTDTAAMDPGTYWYEVEWDNGGAIRTPFGGPLVVGVETLT